MAYQVLARKWRPAAFDALVGQEHVLKALRHALDTQRLHHAYLFTGTRGVGKTTIARIVARCLNCEEGVSAEPCGQCATCVEISEGRSVDLIEVDAASRTKVEDTRELLDNVQYAPTRSRYKIYLIDEVHMLSGHSFNALLKTLEEPPEHVKFLLATTDPQKLPATVLSRCLQFNLKNLSAELIANYLRTVLDAEGIDADESALWLLGRAAAGSMRDALSLTDQAIAFGSGSLAEADVAAMLGTVERSHIFTLLDALIADDGAAVLAACATMDEQGVAFAEALEELTSVLHRIALAQAVPGSVSREFGDAERVEALAAALTAEDVQLFYQLAVGARSQLAEAPEPRAAFEMLALRLLAFRPVEVLDPTLRADDLAPATTAAVTPAQPGEVGPGGKKPEPPPAAPAERPEAATQVADAERSAQGRTDRAVPAATGASSEPVRPSQEVLAEGALAVAPGAGSDEAAAGGSGVAAAHTGSVHEAPGFDEPPAPDSWHEIVDRLGLRGSAYNVASNCVLARRDGEQWILELDRAQGNLFNDRHRGVIAGALSKVFGGTQRVEITPAEVAGETPARRRQRLQREALAEASRALQADPRLQCLMEEFDAEFIADSVRVKEN